MSVLEVLGWIAGALFAFASIGALGLIALFAFADREADKQPPRKKR